ncbi:MAG: AAA family ATPase, partial [Lentisphaeria bacterium]|nr:AAA family ATPase [Lentisphaeria bacterium]
MPKLKALRRLLEKSLRNARLVDQVKIKRDWNKLNLRDLDPEKPAPENLAIPLKRLLERAAAAQERSLKPFADKLLRQYPEELPVSSRHQEIVELIKNNQLLIVAGATGSGKTTQLPKMALDAGCGTLGRIGCTQPRRLAASSLARRAATEMQAEFGSSVGYKVRFDDHTSENTVVKFMTDGILLAETRDDPDLLQYDCIMLDEVHERSLNIDFLLGYLKKLLRRRKNLKVIISSATLESEKLAEFFDNAPFVEIEGRTFPIEDYYMEPEKDEELPEHVARAVEFISEL